MSSTTALSKTVIAENGSVINLPKNFDKLSQRKQKEIVLEALRNEMIMINKLAGNQRELKERIKQQNNLIRNSKEHKDLMKMKKQLKEDARLEDDLLIEQGGMIKLAMQLGIVKEADIRNIVLIEKQ